MTYESFDFKKENGIGHLKLNKGEDFNKMTLNFWYELPRVLEDVKNNCVYYDILFIRCKPSCQNIFQSYRFYLERLLVY